MPSWKKVITSGSNAALNSLTVTNGITGSLFGTASNAVTASYALTSSYSFNPTISGSISLVDYIDFNTGSVTPAWKSGRVFWDNTDGALSVYNAEADITLQVGQENWTRVRNNTGTTITNGTVVRLEGAQGDVPTVVRAQSIMVSGSVNLTNQILGVATHDIEDNSFGYITTQGLVRGLNTNAFNDGDTLFVGTGSAGALQNTAPQAPFEIIPVGVCVKASPGGSGIIYVAVQQPIDFSDLSSAKVEGTYNYGDLWTYERSGSVGVWRHTNQLSGSYGITGSISITGGGVTGSLFGTSSWAVNASTASFVTTAQTASFITGSNVFGPFGSNSIISASFAVSSSRTVSASFASTASFVNTLNQNVLVTGSLTVGSTTTGASENTLTLGPSPAGGSGEGGQLGLNAVGGTFTSASFIDNWQNHIRILRGTNASSDGLIAQWNLHSKQMNLSGYTSPTAIPGTVSGLLAFDTSGNIITTTTGSGGGGVTINNNVDNYIVTATGTVNTVNGESGLQYNGTSLAVTGQVTASGAIISTANGAMYFRGGDDAEFWDINVANTVGIYGQQNADRAGLKLGSSGPTLFGSASRLGIGTTTPTLGTLEVNGNVWANSFTGSLFGTASWATNAQTASFVTGSNVFGPFGSNSIISASFAVSSSRAVTSSFAVSASFATTASFAVSSSRAVTASFALTASTSNQTAASVTFNDGGAGDASGTSFNGSTARTVSFNTVGAPSTSGTNAYGTWNISISGNADTATIASYSEKYTFGTFKFSAGNSISFLTNRSVSSGGAWQSQYSDLTAVLNYINYLYVDIYDEVDNKLYSRRTFADLASFYSFCSSNLGGNSGWASFYAYTNDTSGLNIGGGNVFSTVITPKGTPTGKNKVRSKRTYKVNFSSPAVGALHTYLTTNLVNDLTTAFGSTIANQLITNAKVTEIVNNNLTNFIIINKYKKRDLSNFYAGDLKMSDGASISTDINTTKLLATVLLKYDLPNQLVTYRHASLTYNVGKNSFIPYSPDTDTSYFNLYIMVDTQNTEFRGLVVEPISIDVATIPFNATLDEPEVSYQYFAKWGNKIVNIAKVPRVDSIVRYEMVELGGITSSPSLTKQRNEITLVRLYNNRTCDVFEDSLYIANSTYNANYAVVNKIKLVHYKLVKK